ncbi:hypothetical protein [Desulfonatronum parangueonense]
MNTTAKATIITAIIPTRLSKMFYIDDENMLAKDSGGVLCKGHFEVKEVSTPEALAQLLSGLEPSQAVTWGLPVGDDTQGTIASSGNGDS